MDPHLEHGLNITRRHFLRDGSLGLGAVALSLLGEGSRADDRRTDLNPMAPRRPHFDLFDYKPVLIRRNAENCPDEFLRGRRFAFTTGVPKLLGTPQPFARH